MTIKLTATSFLAGVKQSGLITDDRLEQLLLQMERAGIDCNDSVNLAKGLVERGAITDWQSDKLLQGRHKGFILGRYKLLALLGTGEMSAVYLAEHMLLERRCAIKVLPASKVKDTSYLGRFYREAKAVASLNHNNIVRAYDVDVQSEAGTDIHFLVMEYVEGLNLEKLVTQKGRLDYVEAADYVRQAADGLAHAHQGGLVHRDIKPGNLLIDNHGKVKLLDLGLARFFQSSDEESLTIKHDEKVLGTADYLAPEQAIDSHKVDERADLYSLGCTLYYALTGHPPFTDGTLVQRLLAHQTRTPKPVRAERPDLPEGLENILNKMMAKQLNTRYQTAEEVSLQITKWLVDNAGKEWCQKNVALVAQLKGLEIIDKGFVAGNSAPLPANPIVEIKPTVAEGTSNPLTSDNLTRTGDRRGNVPASRDITGTTKGDKRPGNTSRPGNTKRESRPVTSPVAVVEPTAVKTPAPAPTHSPKPATTPVATPVAARPEPASPWQQLFSHRDNDSKANASTLTVSLIVTCVVLAIVSLTSIGLMFINNFTTNNRTENRAANANWEIGSAPVSQTPPG